jgi:RimJ/RimL family protein N-acetyltransferase
MTLLETPRLILRLPQKSDAERIANQLDNLAVSGNLARVPHPYRLADARAWLATRRPGLAPTDTTFAIDLPGEGLIGHVGFHRDIRGDTVIGYWLGEPYWGKGFMTEATARSLDWFFENTREPLVRSGVFYFNIASLKVQEKLGFTETGRSRLHCLARGEDVEHIDTQLTRATWQARRDAALTPPHSLKGPKT